MKAFGGEEWTARQDAEDEWGEQWRTGVAAPSDFLCIQGELLDNVEGGLTSFIECTAPSEFWDLPQKSRRAFESSSRLPWKMIVRYDDMARAEEVLTACHHS